MKPIYEPKGKAKEYGDYAINIYTGCPHECFYCFAPSVLRKVKDDFHKKEVTTMNKLSKKTIILSVIISLVLSIGLLAIPKHEVPTDAEWEAYLAYEKGLHKQIDNGEFEFEYAVINRDTGEILMTDTLKDCKDAVKYYETTKYWEGEMIIMPTGEEVAQ